MRCCHSKVSFLRLSIPFRIGRNGDSSWESLEFHPDILFHVVGGHRMARWNCLLWKTGRLSETMNRWVSMEPSLRRLEPFRRAISINRKSTRRAYTRIHEPITYSLSHSRRREKESKRNKGKEGEKDKEKRARETYAMRKSSSHLAMNYIISGGKERLSSLFS